MNERIKKLAEQCEDYLSNVIRNDEWLEKFAELIVRECLDQIEQAIPDTTCASAGPYKTAKIAATNRVRKHFGVEE